MQEETPIEKNISAFRITISIERQNFIAGITLDEFNHQPKYFTTKTPIHATSKFLLAVGEYSLELIQKNNNQLTFKRTKKWSLKTH